MKRLQILFLICLILLPPVYASASDLGGMRFGLIRGDVQVRTEDTDDWVLASINMPLREGDRIWVPEEGMAEIQTRDGSTLRLSARSALEILTFDRDSYQTYLTEGRLYANFRGGRDSLLQVDTAVSSVRAYEGSKFNVDVPERGPVYVSVFQGEVNVENRDGRIGVKEGETLSLGEGMVSEKSTLGSLDDWERWNWERDSKIAERRPPSPHLPEELQPYSNDFYGNGRWVHTPDYGYVWTPTVSVSVGWAPYRFGRWVWIGGDYVWVSYEPWGWVPYHYGRWSFVGFFGWCWVPPARGVVHWGPGYVGWVYTSRRVAWVPLAPGEIYYGRGHYGPHSVNITNVHVTNVQVDKVVYKNVRVNNAVTTVNHDTFVRGKPADARVEENPFLTEKIHVGRPPIKPGKTSVMPVVREVPQTKRPPEPFGQANVRELKEQRPTAKSEEASVFAPETRPREMPVKPYEAKPIKTRTERAKDLRQPSSPEPAARTQKETAPPVRGAEKPGPTTSPSKDEQEKAQGRPAGRSVSWPAPSDPAADRTKENRSAPAQGKEQKERVPKDRGLRQTTPSGPAVGASLETRTPGRGTDRRMESRSPEKVIEQARSPERVQPKIKEAGPPRKGTQQASELKTLEKRTERPRAPGNREKGA